MRNADRRYRGLVEATPAWSDADDALRVENLASYAILDTAPDETFDRLATLAATAASASMSLITFVDAERAWHKASVGWSGTELPRSEALNAVTIGHVGPLVIADATADPTIDSLRAEAGEGGIGFYAGVPIRTAEGFTVGSLCVMDHTSRTSDARELDLLVQIGRLIERELELRRAGTLDALTDVFNRASLLDAATRDFARARRSGAPIVVVVLDIDDFRSLNDVHGHDKGDAVLRAVAQQCRQHLRGGDVVGRLGGDEFGLLLPEARPYGAMAVAERIRTAMHRLAEPTRGLGVPFTISAGISSLRDADTSMQAMWVRADEALQRSKAIRDTVEFDISAGT